jgi:hypothetical protein
MKPGGLASTASGPPEERSGREVPSTLDEIEGRLGAWVARVAPAAAVTFGADRPESELGVAFRLVRLRSHPEPRGAFRPPARLWLRYLVTTWAGQPGLADRLLVDLALDAAEQADLEVDLDLPPVDPRTSTSEAVPASFMIRLLISRSRTTPVARRVLQALVVQSADVMSVAGVVLGPEDVPIPGAVIGVIGLDARTTTDAQGAFVIVRVPRTPTPARISVRAKGLDQVVEVPGDTAEAGHMVIRLDLLGRKHA